MKTLSINGTSVVIAHIVSFALADEELARGNRELILRIRLSNRDELVVTGEDLGRVHAQLKKAFGLRRSASA